MRLGWVPRVRRKANFESRSIDRVYLTKGGRGHRNRGCVHDLNDDRKQNGVVRKATLGVYEVNFEVVGPFEGPIGCTDYDV